MNYGPPPPGAYGPPPKKSLMQQLGCGCGGVLVILFGLAMLGRALRPTTSSTSAANSAAMPPAISPAAATATALSTASAAPAVAVEKVSASALLADYKANEVRGDNKWKGHLVAVTGIVGDIRKSAFGSIVVTLGSGAQFEAHTVHCQFKNEEQAAAMSKGDKVTIAGTVTGMLLGSVILGDAELAK